MISHTENDVVDASVTVVYEDDDVVVVNKPAGLVVHADGKTVEPTLVDWIQTRYPSLKDVGEPMRTLNGKALERPGIVHRLDRETSGVLVIAKNQQTFLYLKEQFQRRVVQKTYNAFVYDIFTEMQGVIDRPIGKSKKDFRQWSAQRGARGTLRDAVTDYNVIRQGKEAAFIEVVPQTGRTHQIRVHLKAIHHPIVCDSLYAPKRTCILGFSRLALHARTLSLTLPDGSTITAEAPLPDDFEQALKKL